MILSTSHGTSRWYHLNGRKQGGMKELLDEGEEVEWKSWLKTQHSKNKDHPVPSQIDRETTETVTDFIFLGSKNQCKWWLCCAVCSHSVMPLLLSTLWTVALSLIMKEFIASHILFI